MGLENFTPEKWWAAIFVRLRANAVYTPTVNRQYEGELSDSGSTVNISELEPIGVSNYTKNSDITWSNTVSYSKQLRVDQQKYYARNLDSMDRLQSNVDLQNGIADEAAWGMTKAQEEFIAALYGGAGNSVTSITCTAGNVLTNISNMQYELDNANCPEDNRFFPIMPYYNQMLVQATTGVIGHTGVPKVFNDGILVNGYVGNLFGFNLLKTTLVNHSSTVYQMMAYHGSAIAFVGQLFEADIIKRESRFGVGMKALSVYGGKIIRPEAAVKCQVTTA